MLDAIAVKLAIMVFLLLSCVVREKKGGDTSFREKVPPPLFQPRILEPSYVIGAGRILFVVRRAAAASMSAPNSIRRRRRQGTRRGRTQPAV